MRKIKTISILILLMIVAYQCKQKGNSVEHYRIEDIVVDSTMVHAGKNLTITYCTSCHTNDAKIAPSFEEIKEAYTLDGVSKEEFVMSIKTFLNAPSKDNAKLPEAVKKYGLMPKLTFKEEDIEQIADFLIETDLKNYDWKVDNTNNTSEKNWEEKGLEFAMKTKQELGKNLMQAIQTKGTAGALEFCNIKALPITDSMSNVLNASIKRVSDLERNPKNKANKEELEFIQELKQKLANNEKLVPKVIEKKNKVIAFYGIETNQMCLQCHGTRGKDIQENTLSKINQYYPNDKATGYTSKQIRGLFVVEMKK